jgi:glycosyltransferase involved in cell wall biosynthesis
MSRKFNVCSIGEPSDPKTWSGTPFNLLTEFNKSGVIGSAFASNNTTGLQRLYLKIASKLTYGNSIDMHRGRIYRELYANNVKRMTARSESNLTLHFGTLDFPFSSCPNGQKHFLYCDSTWNLWSKYVTNISLYSKKLLKDTEELEKESYQQITHFFPISNYVKENLISYYQVPEEKITVVGTGLGIINPFFGEKDYSNKKILFTAKGRFEDKGGDLVIEAFKLAHKKDPELQLTIVGQDEYTSKFDLPNVKTYGFIPVEDLQELFNTHSLFIMPAVNEPWGLVYIEALLCKMPIIGLNRNSLPEITDQEKYGFLLDESNPEHLARHFVDLFSNPKKLKEIGLGGQKFVSDKYTWENTAKKIVKTINKIS